MKFLFRSHSPKPLHVFLWMIFVGPTTGSVVMLVQKIGGLYLEGQFGIPTLDYTTAVIIFGNFGGVIPAACSAIVVTALGCRNISLSIVTSGIIGYLITLLYVFIWMGKGDPSQFTKAVFYAPGWQVTIAGAVAAAVTYSLAIWTTHRESSQQSGTNSGPQPDDDTPNTRAS